MDPATALQQDCRFTAALLTTAFCWRELTDLLRLPPPASCCEASSAAAALELALARVRQSDACALRCADRVQRCSARLLVPWRALPTATRRHASRTATAADFTARSIDPSAFLWAIGSDPDVGVRRAWPAYVRRAFPTLAPHLGLAAD